MTRNSAGMVLGRNNITFFFYSVYTYNSFNLIKAWPRVQMSVALIIRML